MMPRSSLWHAARSASFEIRCRPFLRGSGASRSPCGGQPETLRALPPGVVPAPQVWQDLVTLPR